MKWNWQQADWPYFRFDVKRLEPLEMQFLHTSGILQGSYLHINPAEQLSLRIELMADEALKTSEIEGEYLNRDSLQSSIRRNFGLSTEHRNISPAEQGISEMMIDLYRNFNCPLSHEILFDWHRMITNGRRDLHDIGCYRTHPEPMQVISGRIDAPKVHFEAPPSNQVSKEMDKFIIWFNQTSREGKKPLSALTRAGIAHLYFVSIHPFEDGNGRIARAVSEKALSQWVGKPSLIALSTTIQNHKKAYYAALERGNKSNEITNWSIYFSETILEAERYTQNLINFLIQKTKFFEAHRGQMNERQERAIARMLQEGPQGFKGGLSAKKYISMTRASRATATRDLQDLVNKRILSRKGERKGARYQLSLT